MDLLPSLASDNHSGIHPELLEAMASVNEGSSPSYGIDPWSLELKKLLSELTGCIDSHLVFNGTAANVLAVATCLNSYESVLCADHSHLNVDECAAPEKFFGGKLIPLPSDHGKITLKQVKETIVRRGDQHYAQTKMVSLTQPTEYGTVYTLDELKGFFTFCKEQNLYLHLDGSRLANAAHYLNCSLKDIVSLSHVTTFGGSKSGHLLGDLVLINQADINQGFRYLRKQALQLPSKTRFFAKAFLTYFQTELYLRIAQQQHELATYLRDQLLKKQVPITQPVHSNAVFCELEPTVIKALKKKVFFYVWDEKTWECRLMTSYDTTKELIDYFVSLIPEQPQKGERHVHQLL